MGREVTGLLRFAVDPFGGGKMDLLPAESFGPVGLLEAVPDQIGTQI